MRIKIITKLSCFSWLEQLIASYINSALLTLHLPATALSFAYTIHTATVHYRLLFATCVFITNTYYICTKFLVRSCHYVMSLR